VDDAVARTVSFSDEEEDPRGPIYYVTLPVVISCILPFSEFSAEVSKVRGAPLRLRRPPVCNRRAECSSDGVFVASDTGSSPMRFALPAGTPLELASSSSFRDLFCLFRDKDASPEAALKLAVEAAAPRAAKSSSFQM
jgi:hypothetical protein